MREDARTCGQKCCSIWAWLIQLAIWAGIALLCIELKSQGPNLIYYAVGLGILYILYWITMLKSPTFKYVKTLDNNITIKDVLGRIFQSSPWHTFHSTCYHMVTETTTTTHSDGRKTESSSTRRVETHWANEPFRYYSTRDISGQFRLAKNKKGKAYVKLRLYNMVDYVDNISYYDYLQDKDDFQSENRRRDVEMDFREDSGIEGFSEYIMARVGDKPRCCISACVFVLFTLIPIAQLYKSYIDYHCLHQHFFIHKLISTRYDLFSNKFQKELAPLEPMCVLNNKKYTYSDIGGLFSKNQRLPPTERELFQANKYSVDGFRNRANYPVPETDDLLNLNYELQGVNGLNLNLV